MLSETADVALVLDSVRDDGAGLSERSPKHPVMERLKQIMAHGLSIFNVLSVAQRHEIDALNG